MSVFTSTRVVAKAEMHGENVRTIEGVADRLILDSLALLAPQE